MRTRRQELFEVWLPLVVICPCVGAGAPVIGFVLVELITDLGVAAGLWVAPPPWFEIRILR